MLKRKSCLPALPRLQTATQTTRGMSQPVELSGMGLKKTEYTDNILKLLGGFWVTSGHTASSNRDPVICTNKQFPSHPPDCPQAEEGTLH